MAAARAASERWRRTPWSRRRDVLRAFRHALVESVGELHGGIPIPSRTLTQTTVAEVLPLAAACRWLERKGERTLRTRRLGPWRRPLWLPGVTGRVSREPHGAVLILGTWNYPVFLVGVQALQALAAGNAVTIKPGRGCEAVTRMLARLLFEAGLPRELLSATDDSAETGEAAVAAGFDHIVLTGSAETGRRVLRAAAETLTPCTVELSGSDAVLIGEDADLERTARCVAFGLHFNGGATCIAPRRVFVSDRHADAFLAKLTPLLHAVDVPRELREAAVPLVAEALREGAKAVGEPARVSGRSGPGFEAITGTTAGQASSESDTPGADARRLASRPVLLDHCEPSMRLLRSDVFAPVLTVVRCRDAEDMLAKANACPYALGASVFGEDSRLRGVRAECVTVNDLIVPTADPRVPFGGVGESGYGVTRGPEGLLSMTRPRVVLERRGNQLPHLDEPHETDAELLGNAAKMLYGAMNKRWAALKRVIAAGKKRKESGEPPA